MAKTEKESANYQKMYSDVEAIIKEVSNPEVDLDSLVEKVDRGYALIKNMKQRLEETKKKIETLRTEFEAE